MNIGTELLVIGGGATGLSVARDAVLRGFKTVLVEKGDLAHGTSGRYHGLLHSGGRYVVSDPQSARECYAENQILRRLIPSALENTGGLFVTTPHDPPKYADQFLDACQACSIPAEEIPVAQALQREPLLTSKLRRAIQVPDAACDSFDALHILAADVRRHGGEVFLRRRVEELILEEDRVRGVVAHNLSTGARERIHADLVLNCSGAWAGQVAGLGGCEVGVTPGKGTMIAMNVRLVNTVVNRCKPPDDGDILVPVGTVSIIGTTEAVVDNADMYSIEDWEIELLMAEGEKLIPDFHNYRPLRAWAGVRPLYEPPSPPSQGGDREGGQNGSRQISRSHHIINHRTRDGVQGLITIVGGKFTTMRLMAEHMLDVACTELEMERPCSTATTPIEPPDTKYYTRPQRLRALESSPHRRGSDGDIICECELVTQSQIEAALCESGSHVLNDLRRDTRLGMGPCQAAFCAYRATGLVQRLLQLPPPARSAVPGGGPVAGDGDGSRGSLLQLPITNNQLLIPLAQFLQERWKGQRPLLWGHNLRQLELDQNIYRNLLGLDRLPAARQIEVYPTEKTA